MVTRWIPWMRCCSETTSSNRSIIWWREMLGAMGWLRDGEEHTWRYAVLRPHPHPYSFVILFLSNGCVKFLRTPEDTTALLSFYASSTGCLSNSFNLYLRDSAMAHKCVNNLLLAIFAINCANDPLYIAFLITGGTLYKYHCINRQLVKKYLLRDQLTVI